MDKQRNTQYFLKQLSAGDRFYFCGDKNKKVFTVYGHQTFSNEETFFVKKQAGYNILYARVCIDVNGRPFSIPEEHKANRRVIFLRNINDKT